MVKLGLKRNGNVARTAFVVLATIGFACSGSGDDGDDGDAQCLADPDCDGCVPDGEQCAFSINCQAGSICNFPTDDLYDASKDPALAIEDCSVCIRVVCNTDADCDQGRVCSLEKICKPPVCQIDAECTGGQVCRDGGCVTAPDPSQVASCEVVSRATSVREGARIALQAVAVNENGKALAGIPFDWTSSNEAAVGVEGEEAVGGSAQGTANLTAKPAGRADLTCDRSVSITNFPNVPNTEVRVVVVADDDGSAVSGAEVIVEANGSVTATTGADGSATVTVAAGAMPSSVTVIKTGWQYVTIISPGTNDIFLPLPRNAAEVMAGGFRGSVDLSATRKGDIQLGLVGPAIPSNLLDFGLESLIGDFVPTSINAPQLSLDVMEDLPAGLMLGLGSQQFMADETRCQGDMPGANELGCFLARAPEGPGAGWALAGQLKLSAVTSIANDLSAVLGGDGEELPIGELLTAVLPLLRQLNHAVNPSIVTEEFAKVPVEGQTADCTDPANAANEDLCRGDFSRYQKVDMDASSGLTITSAVEVPDLPALASGNGCAQGLVLLSGAALEGRGLVPLGVTAGVDTLEDTETPDCVVAGIEKPFGEFSPDLPDGQMPLSMAPLHSGIEGSDVFLLLVALDLDSITASEGGLALSAIVHRVDGAVADVETIGGSFLSYPTGTITKSTGTVALQNTTGAKVTRLEMQRGGETWLVYAPASQATLTLPTVTRTQNILAGVGDAYVLTMGMAAEYSQMWRFGSGNTLDRLFDFVSGFVVQGCSNAVGATCAIED